MRRERKLPLKPRNGRSPRAKSRSRTRKVAGAIALLEALSAAGAYVTYSGGTELCSVMFSGRLRSVGQNLFVVVGVVIPSTGLPCQCAHLAPLCADSIAIFIDGALWIIQMRSGSNAVSIAWSTTRAPWEPLLNARPASKMLQ